MRPLLLSLVLLTIAAGPAPLKRRVLIFDASDPKKRPSFEYVQEKPEKVSQAPVMMTSVTVSSAPPSSPTAVETTETEPEEVTVSEKKMMLDQGKTAQPSTKKKKKKDKKKKD